MRLSVEACKQEHRGQLYTSLKEIFLHYRHIATWRSACSPTVQHVFFCLLSFWSVFQVFDTICKEYLILFQNQLRFKAPELELV